MTDSIDAVLRAKQLTKRFDSSGEQLTLFENIGFELRPGERVAVTGSSGSGKTTFLHCLAGLESVTSGSLYWQDREVTQLIADPKKERQLGQWRGQLLGFVFQFHHLIQELSALENALLPMMILGRNQQENRHYAMQLFERVGLSHRLDHRPALLSGGERQRVALIRALINKPAFVLADEPTGNLDQHTAMKVQDLLIELSTELNTAFLIVTHDLEFAQRSNRAFHLSSGSLLCEQR